MSYPCSQHMCCCIQENNGKEKENASHKNKTEQKQKEANETQKATQGNKNNTNTMQCESAKCPRTWLLHEFWIKLDTCPSFKVDISNIVIVFVVVSLSFGQLQNKEKVIYCDSKNHLQKPSREQGKDPEDVPGTVSEKQPKKEERKNKYRKAKENLMTLAHHQGENLCSKGIRRTSDITTGSKYSATLYFQLGGRFFRWGCKKANSPSFRNLLRVTQYPKEIGWGWYQPHGSLAPGRTPVEPSVVTSNLSWQPGLPTLERRYCRMQTVVGNHTGPRGSNHLNFQRPILVEKEWKTRRWQTHGKRQKLGLGDQQLEPLPYAQHLDEIWRVF